MYELFDPLRIVIDVAGAHLDSNATLPSDFPQGPISDIKTALLEGQEPSITRLEVYLASDQGYAVERQTNNIVVSFAKGIPQDVLEKEPPPAETIASDQQLAASVIHDIDIDTTDQGTTKVYILADAPVSSFQEAQLPKGAGRPDRMYIDIPEMTLPGNILVKEVGTTLSQIRAAQRKESVRIVFDSAVDKLFDYEIIPQENGLLIAVKEPSQVNLVINGLMSKKSSQATSAPDSPPAGGTNERISPVLYVEPQPAVSPQKIDTFQAEQQATQKSVEKKQEEPAIDSLGFAGYGKQKITVDFYKIDLHNVFRLFREVSGMNLIVDESISGTLTLALNDVPWDFALDIVLNLKDLQKTERFNTLVILPKSKEILWPEQTADNITYTAELTTLPQKESLAVEQKIKQPEEIVAAQKLIRSGKIHEKKGDLKSAFQYYEQAFEKWPTNDELAYTLSTISLIHLRNNAKAAHYAAAAYKGNHTNHNAALQAAIALANMKKIDDAKIYFDNAINTAKPSSEALVSYAAFCEDNNSPNAALMLLKKNNELHGDSLETMVTKARIFDKIGDDDRAKKEYRALLLSGYDLPEDLRRFINGRLTISQN